MQILENHPVKILAVIIVLGFWIFIMIQRRRHRRCSTACPCATEFQRNRIISDSTLALMQQQKQAIEPPFSPEQLAKHADVKGRRDARLAEQKREGKSTTAAIAVALVVVGGLAGVFWLKRDLVRAVEQPQAQQLPNAKPVTVHPSELADQPGWPKNVKVHQSKEKP